MAEYQHLLHTIPPVYEETSRILILGSFPSVKSRENEFFYGHPQNRFWQVLSAVLSCELPKTKEEKKEMLLSHSIAVWDVIESCDIIGSSDASIKNVVPTSLNQIITTSKIEKIYVNGKTAGRLYHKYSEKITGMQAIVLPSTSPANATYSLARLIEEWNVKMELLHI